MTVANVRFQFDRLLHGRSGPGACGLFARLRGLMIAAVVTSMLVGGAAAQVRTIVADVGGTSAFPPYATPGYRTPADVRQIVSGLPAGTEVVGRLSIIDINHGVPTPGGILGGEVHPFLARLVLELQGTGGLAFYNRVIVLPILNAEAHTAPHLLGNLEQIFAANIFQLQAQILGDPDFDLLRVTGGDGFGLPSPGNTTLSPLPNGNWAVDSFFDITYRVDFVGRPGGTFSGLSGSTTTTARIHEGRPMRAVCVSPDIGGTADFPSSCGAYVGDPNADIIRDGLPTGGVLTATMRLHPTVPFAIAPGGSLGGSHHEFGGFIEMKLVGSGPMAGFNRSVSLPILTGEADLGPFTPGPTPQGAPIDLSRLFGQITGDPDFALLRVIGGTDFGLPAPGHRTITRVAGGSWAVDSFFDINYRVDFVGDPGGALAGLSGSTVSSGRFEQGGPVAGVPCDVPDIGGTGELPPPCPSGFAGPPEGVGALNGLPAGSPVQVSLRLDSMTPLTEAAGGSLGGTVQSFKTIVGFKLEGFGGFAGYARTLAMTANGTSEAGPRNWGTTPQSFPMAITGMLGQLFGDPDFDFLRIRVGSVHGLPRSPGHTAFTFNGGTWSVDSFFDVTYEVDFVGAPGGPFAGMSGTSRGVVRLQAGEHGATSAVPEPVAGLIAPLSPARPNPTRALSQVELVLARPARVTATVFDVAGRRVAEVARGELPAGPQVLKWDGQDSFGRPAPAGLYFYRVEYDGATEVRRVVLTR